MKQVMRIGRVILPILACLFVIAILLTQIPVKAEPLDTYHSGWYLIRETASEDGASFSAVYDLTIEGNFANKDSSSVLNGGAFKIPSIDTGIDYKHYSPGSKWMFAFCGENFNNTDDTFSFNLIGWSKTNGMLQVLAEGDCVLGTQAVVVYPDGGDALGATCSETSVSYDHTGGTQSKYFTVTNEGFDGAIVGQLAYVTGTNITSGYYQVLVVTDTNNISIDVTASDDNTNSTVQINPAFWADTINLDETTKWGGALADPNTIYGYYQMPGTIAVINSGDNEVACLIVELTGIEWIQFVLYVCDAATNEEAGNVTVYGRRY